MTVVYNTNFTHNANSYLTLAIETAAREVFGAGNVVLADNRSLAPIAASGLHDVLICIDGQRLHESLLRRVRPSFGTLIMWQFEDPFMQEYNLHTHRCSTTSSPTIRPALRPMAARDTICRWRRANACISAR